MRQLSTITAIALATLTMTSCTKDLTNDKVEVLNTAGSVKSVSSDISTGVIYNGSEIVIADRNVGAEEIGKRGTYMTWEEAVVACPSGYHLMTKGEASAIAEKYSFVDMVNVLMLPASGYLDSSKEFTLTDRGWGFYHLAESFSEDESWFLFFGIYNNGYEDLSLDYYTKSDKNSVRCVKGSAPIASTVK